MSLFPAYAFESKKEEPISKPDSEQWLSNSSFQIKSSTSEPVDISTSSSESEGEIKPSKSTSSKSPKRSKHKKRKRKKSKSPAQTEVYKVVKCTDDFIKNLDGDFGIDKKPQRVYLNIQTIARPAVPKYHHSKYKLLPKPERHFTKKQRYFHKLRKLKNEKSKEETENIDEENVGNEEEKINQKTSYYNQELGRNPFNVELWLEYIKFQDSVWEFENTYRKGSLAKSVKATAERKLSMVEKALTHNPGNVPLIRERLRICEKIYPNDELNKYLKKLVEKEPENIILWQGYIESIQCSMSHCNATAVISMYNECLSKLHQLRRSPLVEKTQLEEKILTMLYQCSLFLRQAGLWEQLWTLLRLYLILNLSNNDKTKFSNYATMNENHLLELEEVILESRLPSHELWLRVEKLRESCHWLPWNGEKACEDPQRTVFVDDLTDLIHPITSKENVFKLTVMILCLLKVPLLPFRHSTLQKLQLDYVPWSLDSIETLLSIYLPQLLIKNDVNFIDGLNEFSVGPQYLKTHPGQEEYLDFLVNVLKKCGECLEGDERTSIFIWWLRFERLLIILDRNRKIKMPSNHLKKVKSSIKEFLKQPENRNNVLFYQEYALIEYEFKNFDSAKNILLTAITMLTDNKLITFLDHETQRNLCSLIRTLIELTLRDSNLKLKRELISHLVSMVSDDDSGLNDILLKYSELTENFFDQDLSYFSLPSHFLPDFLTDWIICNATLVYLVRTPFESGIVIENALKRLEEKGSNVWRKEVLLEWYVSMLYKTCLDNAGIGLFKLFRDTINRSLEEFPNNLYLLTVASLEQTMSGCLTQSWWKLSNILLNQGHSVPAIFLIFVTNNILSKRIEQWNVRDKTDPVLALTSIKNRILSVFKKLTSNTMTTKRCGLIWRLYLQFLYKNYDPELLRKIYYAAVEECPWLKALYIDAAVYIPAELSQIQDLIVEKELRIHLAPEELEILKT